MNCECTGSDRTGFESSNALPGYFVNEITNVNYVCIFS